MVEKKKFFNTDYDGRPNIAAMFHFSRLPIQQSECDEPSESGENHRTGIGRSLFFGAALQDLRAFTLLQVVGRYTTMTDGEESHLASESSAIDAPASAGFGPRKAKRPFTRFRASADRDRLLSDEQS